MIKTISDLRHKICQARQNLEHETEVPVTRFFLKRVKKTRFVFQLKQSNLLMLFQRKRAAEKNLTEMRREVSKQKRLMSTRRCVPLPAITTVRKCVK